MRSASLAVILLLFTSVSVSPWGLLRIASALIGGAAAWAAALIAAALAVGAFGWITTASFTIIAVGQISFVSDLLCGISRLVFTIPVAATQFLKACVIARI